MVAYGTMQESEAFRNLCRAYDIPQSEFNEVGKDLNAYKNHSKWGKIIEESKMFIGVIDSLSPHPCANLLLSEPISEEIGIIRTGSEGKKKGIIYCALIDSNTSDEWKYLKNDYLSVSVWEIISQGFKAIGRPIPDVRELSKLVEKDAAVWDLYEKGLTATLNQVGTDSGTPQIMQYKPKNIRELSGWVSAIRPQFASMKSYFLNREKFSYDIPAFDEILKESDNFVLYQENVMATLVFAGFDEDKTYSLLKAIAKKKEGVIEKIHDQFINGFVEKTGSKENALKVWKILEDSVKYGFNSSHAYSVALDSVYGAYLKANYPLEYYAVVLNLYESDTTQTSKIMKELKHFDIKIEQIQFGKSRAVYSIDKQSNTIYKGISSIKHLNEKVAEELYSLAQNKHYNRNDWVGLLVDIMDQTKVQSNQMEILIRLDFFREFGEKEVLLEVYLTMADKKKADTEKYHEFADKTIITEKINKRTKEVKIEEKVIKRPLKYDSKHVERTRLQRIDNIMNYELAVRSDPPQKIELYEQIAYEKEVLGYAYSKWEHLDSDIALVVDINKQYTPKIQLYQLQTGEEFTVKVAKKKFWWNDEPLLFVGDVIRISEVIQKNGWKMEDGKWVENPNVQELHLEKAKIIRESPQRNVSFNKE